MEKEEFKTKAFLKQISMHVGLILLVMISFNSRIIAQDTLPADSVIDSQLNQDISQKEKTFKMTTLTFGGSGVSFTNVKDHFTVMTGGRGSATFNHRYTIGGGGWGMTKGVEVESSAEGIYNFVKMGYGGIDFGYLIFPGEKVNLGTRLLIGGGALFNETVPESKKSSFGMFPVLEPAVYYQVSLSKLFKFEMGANYRFIWGTNQPNISNNDLSGFSFHIGFLVRACNCE
jgi:hypothetical protein